MEQTKNNGKEILYGIALAIILITSLIPQTAIYTRNENALLGIITNSIQALGYLLCLVKIVLSRKEYSINEIIFFCILFAVFLISGFNIQHKFFFLTAILLISTVGQTLCLYQNFFVHTECNFICGCIFVTDWFIGR